jgi:hypothetical protein
MQRISISVPMDFSLLSKVMADAENAGRSVEEQIEKILSAAMPSSKPKRMSAEETVALALIRAEAKQVGEEFELEALFKPEEWARVEKPKVCGRMFRKRAEARKIVELIYRTISRHAVYRRVV